MHISISIMAHPSRKDFIPYIFGKLGFEVPVAWDKYQNRWETGKRAWQLHDSAADYHLVLQDDVLLSKDLPAALPLVAAAAPGKPISLFARNKKKWNHLVCDAQRRRKIIRWLVLQRLNWGPAVMLPVADIKPMIRWVDRNCYMPNYDVRIGYWYLTKNRPVFYTMPSLVDHRTEGDSLVWSLKSQQNRYAKYFIGEDACGADLDWRGEVLREAVPLKKYLIETSIINERHFRALEDGGMEAKP